MNYSKPYTTVLCSNHRRVSDSTGSLTADDIRPTTQAKPIQKDFRSIAFSQTLCARVFCTRRPLAGRYCPAKFLDRNSPVLPIEPMRAESLTGRFGFPSVSSIQR